MLSTTVLPRRVRGFTLTEAAIVLGIVGLILGAIWVAAASVYTNMRVKTATTQVLQIVQGVRTLYGNQMQLENGAAQNSINLALVNSGSVPRDIISGTAANPTFTSQWGGNVVVAFASATTFTVSYDGAVTDACVGMLTELTGSTRDSGLTTATVNAAPVAIPVTPTAAQAACNAAANTLVFTFRHKA